MFDASNQLPPLRQRPQRIARFQTNVLYHKQSEKARGFQKKFQNFFLIYTAL